MRCVAACASKNRHQKAFMCSKEIGLPTPNLLSIKSNYQESTSKVGDLYDLFKEKENLHFDIVVDIHTSSKTLMRKMGTASIQIC